MDLKPEFGIDFEIRRVKNTLAKLEWYSSQGYKPLLPEGISNKSSEREIQNQIKKEFDEKKYIELVDLIISDFSKIKTKFSKTLKFFSNVPEIFFVYLTRYGTNGSYNSPNIVIVNINNRWSIKTIVHEIIHLLIEPHIQKYKIQHWEKERIVDLILNSEKFNFLEYNRWQKDYRTVENYIDTLFESYFFKNPEKFFSKIESSRPLNFN